MKPMIAFLMLVVGCAAEPLPGAEVQGVGEVVTARAPDLGEPACDPYAPLVCAGLLGTGEADPCALCPVIPSCKQNGAPCKWDCKLCGD